MLPRKRGKKKAIIGRGEGAHVDEGSANCAEVGKGKHVVDDVCAECNDAIEDAGADFLH